METLNRERGELSLMALLNKLSWEEMRTLLYKCVLKDLHESRSVMNPERVTRAQQQQDASSCYASGAIVTPMVARERRDQGDAMGQDRAKRARQQQGVGKGSDYVGESVRRSTTNSSILGSIPT